MKGYKAFDENLRCRGFQYEIGQTYEMDGEIDCCERGFHFCKDFADCYKYYPMSEDTRICEVEAIGEIKTDKIRYCTNKIKILSEVENPRERSNVDTSSSGYLNSGCNNSGSRNSGSRNSGSCNSGDHNSGNCNSGHYNSGNCNSGVCNSGNGNTGKHNSGFYNTGNGNTGNRNSGNWNSGFYNTGNCNIGDWNSGNYNTGNRNTGQWNSGNYHTGVFNCDPVPKIKMFDEESDWTIQDWYSSNAYVVMCCCPFTHTEYDDEKKNLIVHKVTAEDKQKWWDGLDESDKNAVKSLPNFNADKFYLCTEIRV